MTFLCIWGSVTKLNQAENIYLGGICTHVHVLVSSSWKKWIFLRFSFFLPVVFLFLPHTVFFKKGNCFPSLWFKPFFFFFLEAILLKFSLFRWSIRKSTDSALVYQPDKFTLKHLAGCRGKARMCSTDCQQGITCLKRQKPECLGKWSDCSVISFQHWLTELEIFAMIFAAAIHDYEHTGTTNNFHIQTRWGHRKSWWVFGEVFGK